MLQNLGMEGTITLHLPPIEDDDDDDDAAHLISLWVTPCDNFFLFPFTLILQVLAFGVEMATPNQFLVLNH